MTYPNGTSSFADLQATDAELADPYEVLDEVQAEEDAGMLGDPLDDGEDYGPWHDSAGLSSDDLGAIELAGSAS